jgi:hypothetical protein
MTGGSTARLLLISNVINPLLLLLLLWGWCCTAGRAPQHAQHIRRCRATAAAAVPGKAPRSRQHL